MGQSPLRNYIPSQRSVSPRGRGRWPPVAGISAVRPPQRLSPNLPRPVQSRFSRTSASDSFDPRLRHRRQRRPIYQAPRHLAPQTPQPRFGKTGQPRISLGRTPQHQRREARTTVEPAFTATLRLAHLLLKSCRRCRADWSMVVIGCGPFLMISV